MASAFWLLVVNDYLLVMIGTFWLLATTVQAKGIFRRQAAALLTGILLVWIANFLYLGQWVSVSWLDLTPFAMTIAGAIYVWNLLRLHLFEVVPVARTVIYESIHDAIVVTDLHQRIVEINQAAQQFFAPPPGRQLVGTLLSPLIGEQAPSISAIIEQQAEWRGDTRLVAGGAERVFDLRISTVRGGDQCPLGWLYIFHDITRRWQAEHELERLALQLEERVQERTHALETEMAERQVALVALAESEGRNRAILDTIPDLMVRITCNGGNPCALQVEAVHPDRKSWLHATQRLDALLPANLRQLTDRAVCNQSGHVERTEYDVLLDGEPAVLEARITSISELECLAMIRDITVQRRAELQLRYQANLLDNISDAVISVDNNLRVISWNRAAEVLYGYPATEVIGRPLRE
ncbi:MAG: PAS domain S-box protein [Anaerolineales bacterium]|nr:PAS domain S-box protein [Anaerolineales bacterium]